MKISYNRTEVIPAMALVGPLAVLFVIRVLLGNGPMPSPAATEPSDPTYDLQNAAANTSTISLTKKQQDALAWLSSHPLPTEFASPMYHPPASDDSPNLSQEYGTEKKIAPLAESAHLSSVAGMGKRAVASINGRLYRIGDELPNGWTITKIDVVNRQVTCQHSTGIVQVLEPAPKIANENEYPL